MKRVELDDAWMYDGGLYAYYYYEFMGHAEDDLDGEVLDLLDDATNLHSIDHITQL